MTRHRLLLRTHDGEALADITNPIEWELARVANDVGWFTLLVDSDFPEQYLSPDNIIEFWRQPTGGSETSLGVGFMRYWEWRTAEDGSSMLQIGGPDPIELLSRRIIMNYAETSYSQKSGAADDVLKEIVDEQFVSTGNRFTDTFYSRTTAIPSPHLSIAPDEGEGEDISIQRAWRNILPVCQEIANSSWNLGTRIYFDFDYVGPAELVFKTWANLRGIDRTIGSDIAPILFSLEGGNILNPSLRYDYTEEVNMVAGGGQGQGTAREIDTENDPARGERTVWNEREAFQDARECPEGESPTLCIASKAYSRMQDGLPRVYFDGELLDTPTSRFGIDWGYGDKVTVRYRGSEFVGPVDQFSITVKNDGTEDIVAAVSITEELEGNPD